MNSIRQIIRSKIANILKPLVILLLSVLPFMKLIIGNGYFAIGDYVLPIFPDREITRCISLWDESFLLGRLTTPIPLANLPQYIIYYIMYVLLGFENTSRLLFPIVFIIAGFSMYILSRYFVRSYIPNLASVILYIYNPWIIDRILSGHISILIAYALTPLTLALYFKGIDEKRLKPILQSSLLLALIISVSYHIAPLVILVVLIYPFKTRKLGNILKTYRLTVTTVLLAILLNSYWITTFPMVSGLIRSHVSIKNIEGLSMESNIINVLRLHGYFGIGWWNFFESMLLPILRDLWWILSFLPITMLIPTCIRKVKFPILMVIIYSIPAVGLNWPFQPINKFLYENIPFYTIYREPNKFVSMICLAYSISIAYAIDWFSRFKSRFMVVSILTLLLLNSWPLLTGDLCGYLQPYSFPNDYVDVDRWLQDKDGNFRILWLPPVEIGAEFIWRPKMKGLWDMIDPLRYSVFSKPSVGFTHTDEWFGGVGNTIYFLHFLYNQIHRKELSSIIPLLNMLNVKYIIFRGDITTTSCTSKVMGSEEINRIENKLNETFKLVYKSKYLRVYENLYVNPSSFIATNNSLIIIGCLEALTMISNINGAIFMIDELNMNDLEKILNISSSTFIFLDADLMDAAICLVGDKYSPSRFSMNGWIPVSQEWWEEDLNQIVTKGYIHNGVVYSENINSTITVNVDIDKSGVYQLWIKALLTPKPPSLRIYLDNSLLTNIDLYSPTTIFKYIPIQTVYLPSGCHSLKISLKNGKAVLGDLVVANKEEIIRVIARLEEFLYSSGIKVINIYSPNTISGLSKPKHGEQLTINNYGVLKVQAQIYKSGKYIIGIKANGTINNVKLEFNNTIYEAEYDNTYIKSIVDAGKGTNNLEIYVEGNTTISYITIMEKMEVAEVKEPIIIKKSQLEYTVKNITGIVVFKQSYNHLWLAHNKETYRPIPSLLFNSYPAQKEITIKLEVREEYTVGIIISIATLVAVIITLSKQCKLQISRKLRVLLNPLAKIS
ncbi:MAG: hypothetical protein QW803_12520 [Candidatus Methanomethylicia archaeon]